MDKIKELTDFYMWMQENDYDHNIRARVEKKAEIYLRREVRDFINSLTIKEYNRLRGSLSDAEARRILLEKANKKSV